MKGCSLVTGKKIKREICCPKVLRLEVQHRDGSRAVFSVARERTLPYLFLVSDWLPVILFCWLFLLGPHPWHMEVPRLGVESKLQLLTYATAMPDLSFICVLHHILQECQTLNPLNKAKDQTHILMDTSQVCNCWATMGIPDCQESWVLPGLQLLSFKLGLLSRSLLPVSLCPHMVIFL